MTVQERIDEVLLAEQEASLTRVRSGLWSPSSFGGCYRKQYWNRKNEPKTNPPDERSLRVFKAGHFFHEFVQKIILEQCPEAQVEVPIKTDDVMGYADIVLPDEVVEIKSQHSKAFWWMDKSDKPITEEKADHILQASFYAVTLGKEWIRLVYVSKDDLCVREFKLRLTDELKSKVTKELNTLNKLWAFGELPKAEPRLYKGKDGKSKECSYCAWKTKCEEVESGNQSSNKS
jgi:hypothetical protein